MVSESEVHLPFSPKSVIHMRTCARCARNDVGCSGAQSTEKEQAGFSTLSVALCSGLQSLSPQQVTMDMDPLADVSKLVLGTHLGPTDRELSCADGSTQFCV